MHKVFFISEITIIKQIDFNLLIYENKNSKKIIDQLIFVIHS